jgi:hypothetical protein
MSEGPPKKPEQPAELEGEEKHDDIAIFDEMYALFSDIDLWTVKPSGEAVRTINALNAAYRNIEHAFKTNQEVGPYYVHYVKALRAVLSEESIWNTLRGLSGDTRVQWLRDRMRTHLATLERQMIDNFKFTGPKQ